MYDLLEGLHVVLDQRVAAAVALDVLDRGLDVLFVVGIAVDNLDVLFDRRLVIPELRERFDHPGPPTLRSGRGFPNDPCPTA